MIDLRHIGRWLTSLSARITFFVLICLVTAQILGVFVISKFNEREQTQVRVEGFIRSIATALQVIDATPEMDHDAYMRSLNNPGTEYWIGARPAVHDDVTPAADWPEPPPNWRTVSTTGKRIAWHADDRPVMVRYQIAAPPLERGPRPTPPPEVAQDPRFKEQLIAGDIPPEQRPGGFGPPPPPDVLDGKPPDDPRFGPPPGPGGPGGRGARPPVRWMISVPLKDGTWFNAELMYEMGLPPWLKTVMYENAVIFALMFTLVVPAIALSTRRLTQLTRAADRLGRGEETEPLPESGASEIRHLTQAFNAMSLRLRRFVQGRTQMLAGISHDLRTPITALRLRTDLVDDDENRERMQALIDDMHHLTEATLTLAKDDSFTEKTDKVDLSSLIEGICDDLTDAGIDATAQVERGVSLMCRPYSLRRAIRNIAENGAKYGKRARIGLADAGRNIRIIVDDDGPGIPEDQMERAFQPFVRLEASRSRETGGSGLGLAITRSIILNHGGEIAMANRPEGGLRVTITLPKGEDA